MSNRRLSTVQFNRCNCILAKILPWCTFEVFNASAYAHNYEQATVPKRYFVMPPPHRVDALSDDVCLSVCLSVAYIRPKSRTERPRKTKIGTEVAHITRDSDTTFKIKRWRLPCRFGWLFKSPLNLSRCQQFICHRPERAAACRPLHKVTTLHGAGA